MAYDVELLVAAKSDTGRVRPHNEDSIACNAEHGLLVLADGMGGYNAGEVASAIATATLKESLTEQLRNHDWRSHANHGKFVRQLLQRSAVRANAAILEAARGNPGYGGMGTTLVAAIFHGKRVSVAHVGDSRAYRFRNGELTQMTKDHSVLQEQIDAGLIDPEQARFSPNRSLITRALGIDSSVIIDVSEQDTLPGDLYLLCSDGLTDMLAHGEIAGILAHTHTDPDKACDTLVDTANRNGGRDNTSVILALVRQNHSSERLRVRMLRWLARLRRWKWLRRILRRGPNRKSAIARSLKYDDANAVTLYRC